MTGTHAEPDAAQLRELLGLFHELPPKVKTRVRRDLRRTGDDVIAAQRAILDGPLPAGVAVTGRRLAVSVNQRTGLASLRALNVFGDSAVQRGGRSSGLREGIKSALATRIVTGTTRQGIEIKTQNGKGAMSTGWNAKRFRHPVFGDRGRMVYQAGQPYFFAPVINGRDAMIASATDILNDAMEGR